MKKKVSTKPISEHSRRQREKILRAASRLFWQKTYLGTSIDDIADIARINKATIYYYFKSKSVILYEIVMEYMQNIYEQALAITNSTLPPEKKLEVLLSNYLKWQISHPGQAIVGQIERRSLPPKLLRSHTAIRDQYEAIFSKVINEILAANQSVVVDEKMTCLFTLGLANSVVHWYKPNGRLPADEVVSQAVTYIMRAISSHMNSSRPDIASQVDGIIKEKIEAVN